jgi:cell division transport system permease protein
MVTSSIKDDLRSFRRSWVHHTGMQLATLTVLAATFTVVAYVFILSLNLKRVLSSWGDSVQLTVYLADDVSNVRTKELEEEFKSLHEVSTVKFIAREQATEKFRTQMASYAPDLLSDAEFSHPFPASFQLGLKAGVRGSADVAKLEELSAQLMKLEGVEDVSFGQSWVKNYSSFVSALSATGGVIATILLAGSVFVVGNSIRASIAARREEIEILELIGATKGMIRRPYIAEGALMGFVAAALALSVNLGLHLWQMSLMKSSLAFARIAAEFSFLDPLVVAALIFGGGVLGALGAWFTVRQINDGWAASQRAEG